MGHGPPRLTSPPREDVRGSRWAARVPRAQPTRGQGRHRTSRVQELPGQSVPHRRPRRGSAAAARWGARGWSSAPSVLKGGSPRDQCCRNPDGNQSCHRTDTDKTRSTTKQTNLNPNKPSPGKKKKQSPQAGAEQTSQFWPHGNAPFSLLT